MTSKINSKTKNQLWIQAMYNKLYSPRNAIARELNCFHLGEINCLSSNFCSLPVKYFLKQYFFDVFFSRDQKVQ